MGIYHSTHVDTPDDEESPVGSDEWNAGHVIEDGSITAAKLAAGVADRTYVHYQVLALASWTVHHNLGKKCSVTVVDSAGSTVIGNVDYIDLNEVLVTFSAPFSGEAYCN
jgi:hypothetical protein